MSIAAAAEYIKTKYGKLDALINNAGELLPLYERVLQF
jgi:NAD(P)-dependent dehydrogenase (short-subunit alcohol dehydrogenase family)